MPLRSLSKQLKVASTMVLSHTLILRLLELAKMLEPSVSDLDSVNSAKKLPL